MELDIKHQSRIVHFEVAKYFVSLHPLDKCEIAHPDDEGVWEKMALGMRAFDQLMPTDTCIPPRVFDDWVSNVATLVEFIGFQKIQNPKNQRLTHYDPLKAPIESYIDTVLSVYGSTRLPATVLDEKK